MAVAVLAFENGDSPHAVGPIASSPKSCVITVPDALLKWAPHAIYAILGIIFVAGLTDVYVPDTGPRVFVRDGAACFPGCDGGKACIAKLQEYEDAG